MWRALNSEGVTSRRAQGLIPPPSTLGRLVDKSLVPATDLGASTRYKMLRMIRDALERLFATDETPHSNPREVSQAARTVVAVPSVPIRVGSPDP